MPYGQVMDEFVEAGYDATEWGPACPTDPVELREALGSRGLDMVGAFVGLGFRDADRIESEIERALDIARFLAANGGKRAHRGRGRRRPPPRRGGPRGRVPRPHRRAVARTSRSGLNELGATGSQPLGMSARLPQPRRHLRRDAGRDRAPARRDGPGAGRLVPRHRPPRLRRRQRDRHAARVRGPGPARPPQGRRRRHPRRRRRPEGWSFGTGARRHYIFPPLGQGIAQRPRGRGRRCSGRRLRRLVRHRAGHRRRRPDGRWRGPTASTSRRCCAGAASAERRPSGPPRAATAVDHADLEALARRGRLLVIETVAHSGAGHVGGPLSAMDLLVALYFRVLRIRPEEPGWAGARPVHPVQGPQLDRPCTTSWRCAATSRWRSCRPSTPAAAASRATPTCSACPASTRPPARWARAWRSASGSRWARGGAACGSHTFVMLGDGEIQEGQVWETVHVAPRVRGGQPHRDRGPERPPAVRLAAGARRGAPGRPPGPVGRRGPPGRLRVVRLEGARDRRARLRPDPGRLRGGAGRVSGHDPDRDPRPDRQGPGSLVHRGPLRVARPGRDGRRDGHRPPGAGGRAGATGRARCGRRPDDPTAARRLGGHAHRARRTRTPTSWSSTRTSPPPPGPTGSRPRTRTASSRWASPSRGWSGTAAGIVDRWATSRGSLVRGLLHAPGAGPGPDGRCPDPRQREDRRGLHGADGRALGQDARRRRGRRDHARDARHDDPGPRRRGRVRGDGPLGDRDAGTRLPAPGPGGRPRRLRRRTTCSSPGA